MHMIADVPGDTVESGIEGLNQALYTQVKRLLLLSQLECRPSLDLVQAWLLMASHEIGHGLDSAALLSIGTCTRLAILLGFDRLSGGVTGSTRMEEIRRTWWGIFIVERYTTKELICSVFAC